MSTATASRARQGQADKTALLARLQGKKPQSAMYEVVLDPGPLQQLTEARSALGDAELFERDVDAAKAAVAAAEEAAADASIRLHYQGLPRDFYEALMLKFPPTSEQEAKKQAYNVETFMPALIAATVVADPDVVEPIRMADLDPFLAGGVLPGRLFSTVEVAGFIEPWNQAEVAQVWNTAVAVCTQVRNPTLPFGSRPTRG